MKFAALMNSTICVTALCSSVNGVRAEDSKISVAGGKLELTSPAGWERKKPSSGIVEHEFNIPKAEGDGADGRMTVMGAGGTRGRQRRSLAGAVSRPKAARS